MANIEKLNLNRENVERFKKITYWPLKISGFSRFSIVNDAIVKKSASSIIYGTCVLTWAILALVYILYELTIVVEYMVKNEVVILLQISGVVYSAFANITFGNRNTGTSLLRRCVDIDVLLGVRETKFMRDIAHNAYIILCFFILLVQVIVLTFLYISFKVTFLVHVVGSIYILWAFFVLYDVNFMLMHSAFISMRTRYLNVAIMKRAKMKIDFIPNIFLFNIFFWKPEHNVRVMFHKVAETGNYIRAFKMIFHQYRCFERCYRFTLLMGMVSISVGSLFSVQLFIAYDAAGYGVFNKVLSVCWIMALWLYFLAVSIQIDFFSKQIAQTKLICFYSQLTQPNSEDILILTKRILQPLEVRDTRVSVYGLFYFDTGMMFRIAGSTFVYITAMLQINVTKSDNSYNFNNTTSITFTK